MHPLDLIEDRYIVMLKGKPHPMYPGVLQAAMKAGLLELNSKIVQFPHPDNGNMAIVEAMAVFPGPDGRERIFTEVGDCDDHNCGAMIAPHKVRMASTRARGRCLRDALGLGIALVEEMTDAYEKQKPEYPITTPKAVGQRAEPVEPVRSGDDGRVPAMEPARPTPGANVRAPQSAPPDAPAPCSTPGCGVVCNRPQIAVSWRSYGQIFCPKCQRENNLANKDVVTQHIAIQSPNAAAAAAGEDRY